ncbi:MAG: YebC/PmpR family DNA-binding transcriptional regulator [Candidatus Levyibacteriota bacterium]
MSGHSKWAQIKRQKGVTDIKRGQIFTKLANAITIAVKQGGGIGDPSQNFRLRLLIEKARAVNMPKSNIDRAIQRAQGKQAEQVENVTYEGFGPNGIAIIIEAVTDNKLRTTSEVKNLFDKNGANLGIPGSVSYMFQTKGLISVKKNEKTIDDIFLVAADLGAEDVEDVLKSAIIYTKPEELTKIKDALTAKGFIVEDFELARKPLTEIQITNKDTANKILAFIEKLEDLDEVQKVYSNFDIQESLITFSEFQESNTD